MFQTVAANCFTDLCDQVCLILGGVYISNYMPLGSGLVAFNYVAFTCIPGLFNC